MFRRTLTLLLLCTMLLPAAAMAQGRESAVIKKLGKETVTVNKPDGWVVGKPPRGTIALFRAAGDAKSQIEVKRTPGVKDAQAERFFASFHTNLKKMGLKEAGSAVELAIPGFLKGSLTEYTLTSKGEPYRMLVWQALRGDAAWMVVGFFPEKARDVHFGAMQKLMRAISFSTK